MKRLMFAAYMLAAIALLAGAAWAGDDFEVLGVEYKTLVKPSGFVNYSMKVGIRNNGADGRFRAKLVFLDGDGFEVLSTFVDGPVARGAGAITGTRLISGAEAARVRNITIHSARRL